jgi:hypothetical protein
MLSLAGLVGSVRNWWVELTVPTEWSQCPSKFAFPDFVHKKEKGTATFF